MSVRYGIVNVAVLASSFLMSAPRGFAQTSPSPTWATLTSAESGLADRRPSVSLMAGQFMYGLGGTTRYPYASARIGRDISQFFAGELSVGYSRVSTTLYSFTPSIQAYTAHTPFLTADGAGHAILPNRRLAPYIGVSAGVFRRLDSDAYDGLALNGTSVGVLAGAKWRVGKRLGLRAEFRVRSDRHSGLETPAIDAEQSFGIFYRM